MKLDSLGANHLLSGAAVDQTVIPPSTFASSVQLMMHPPQSSNLRPSTSRYHAAKALLSPVLLMNTPPIPVIFAIFSLGRLGRKNLAFPQQRRADQSYDHTDGPYL